MEDEKIWKFKEELEGTICNMGISEEYKNDVAFERVIFKIKMMLGYQFHNKYPFIKKQDNKIIITDTNGLNFSIEVSNSNTITVTLESLSSNVLQKEKNVDRLIASYNNGVTLKEFKATSTPIDEKNCEVNQSYQSSKYQNGIEVEQITQVFPSSKIESKADLVNINSMIELAQAYNSTVKSSIFPIKKKIMRRHYFDVADITLYESEDIVFQSKVPLNGEHGYQNMTLSHFQYPYPEKISIPSLSEEQMISILSHEKNEQVRNALLNYTKNREFRYNSFDDESFINVNCSQKKL